jgi:VanZ family protein
MLVSGRESDLRDWIADTAGALIGSMWVFVKNHKLQPLVNRVNEVPIGSEEVTRR